MKSNDFPDSFYRTVVKALYVKDNKILFAKEAPHLADKWELPGGGLDFGEDPRMGLVRELKEELNLDVTHVSKHPVYVWTNKFEGCRDMDWYYSVVLAYRVDIANLDFSPTEEVVAIDLFDINQVQALDTDLYHQSRKLIEHFNPEDFVAEISE